MVAGSSRVTLLAPTVLNPQPIRLPKRCRSRGNDTRNIPSSQVSIMKRIAVIMATFCLLSVPLLTIMAGNAPGDSAMVRRWAFGIIAGYENCDCWMENRSSPMVGFHVSHSFSLWRSTATRSTLALRPQVDIGLPFHSFAVHVLYHPGLGAPGIPGAFLAFGTRYSAYPNGQNALYCESEDKPSSNPSNGAMYLSAGMGYEGNVAIHEVSGSISIPTYDKESFRWDGTRIVRTLQTRHHFSITYTIAWRL